MLSISPGQTKAWMPCLYCVGDTLAVVWEQSGQEGMEIDRSFSLDGGRTWAQAQLLSQAVGECPKPWAVIQGDRLHLVWQNDSPGNWEIFYRSVALPPTGVTDSSAPGTTLPDKAVLTHHPNPVLSRSQVRFAVAEGGKVDLTVYNLLGQRVRTLHAGPTTPGWHSIIWNRESVAGSLLPAGSYFLRLRVGETSLTRKLTVIE